MNAVREAVQGEERLSALATNVMAVRAVAAAVEGTIGPKGLDVMLVNRNGGALVTNDGIAILTAMEVTHPAARMAVNVARAQEEAIGDGTTTATILAGALLTEALEQVERGVPAVHILEGVRQGIDQAAKALAEQAVPVSGPDDPLLEKIALVAGRGRAEIADLVVRSARLWGREAFADPTFRLDHCITAEEGAASEVFAGVLVERERSDRQQPLHLSGARILVLDDALEPEALDPGAFGTAEGFQEFLRLRAAFRSHVEKLLSLGVSLLITDRAVDDEAHEMLTEAGVMVLQRVSMQQWRRAAEHTGARPIRRPALRKPAGELARSLGRAESVTGDERLRHVRIVGGAGRPMATVLIGAATTEVMEERERIAKDAAAAVQAALWGGAVPGGGAAELHAGAAVDAYRGSVRGLAAYGVGCVAAALKRPLGQIVANAGLNPMEKVEEAVAAQRGGGNGRLGIDCDTGLVTDMWQSGVIDPAVVKIHALKAAGEIAEAILRIDTIIRMGERTQ
jgi:archaeal chaperonin